MSDKINQNNQQYTNFIEIISEVKNEFKPEMISFSRNYASKLKFVYREMEKYIMSKCPNEYKEMQSFLKLKEDGKSYEIIEGKEKEYEESEKKFLKCSKTLISPFEKAKEIMNYTRLRGYTETDKCLGGAYETYLKTNNRDEAKINLHKCLNRHFKETLPIINLVDTNSFQYVLNDLANKNKLL